MCGLKESLRVSLSIIDPRSHIGFLKFYMYIFHILMNAVHLNGVI